MGTIAKFSSLAHEVGKAAEQVAALTKATDAFVPAAAKAAGAMGTLRQAADDVKQAVEAVNPGGGGQVNEHSSKEAVLSKLADLENRLKSQFGDNNFAAALIQRRIEEVQSGRQSAADAVEFIRQYFASMIAGLMQDAASPDAAVRDLALELERLVASGIFQ